MRMKPAEYDEWNRLIRSLDAFVARRSDPAAVGTTDELVDRLTQPARAAIRARLWADRGLLDAFLAANPDRLPPALLDEARAFRHAVTGRFFCERVLKRHAMLIQLEEPLQVFAVEGLTDSVDELLGSASSDGAGVLLATTLLPWRGRIVWDGFVTVFPLRVGPGIRREYRDLYLTAKARGEIATTLGEAPKRAPAPPPSRAEDAALIEEIAERVERLKLRVPPLERVARPVLRAAVALARAANQDDRDATIDATQALDRALRAVYRAL